MTSLQWTSCSAAAADEGRKLLLQCRCDTMVFDLSLPTRGLEISQILSDEAHYVTFICGTCDKLVCLDSVVTTSCGHPHCRKCIEGASMEAFMRQKPCQCPKCDGNIQQPPQSMPTDCMQFGPVTVMVRPLPLAQPLAFQCLRKVQVACHGCDWQGRAIPTGQWR